MDLNEVFIFLKVVQAGSFSQAAKALNIPNSTVSFKVSSLEKRLGVTLIRRTTRKLNITPAGEAFYKRCLAGVEEIQAAQLEITSSQGEPQGLLRLTAPVDLGASVLPKVVASFMQKFSKVSVEVLLTDRRVDLLSESVDLAIRAGELKDSTLIAKKIGATYFVPVASPKYLKKNSEPKHPRELIHHKCLQFTPFGLETWKFVSAKGAFNAPVPGRFVVNHMEMVRLMALDGEGIACLPTNTVYEDVKAGRLKRILGDWRSQTGPVHFVYPAQRFVTPKLSAFIEHATLCLKESFKHFEI